MPSTATISTSLVTSSRLQFEEIKWSFLAGLVEIGQGAMVLN